MSQLSRDPKGHFISREAALVAWLPALLDGQIRYRNDALREMLQSASVFCDRQAAKCYGAAVYALTGGVVWQFPEGRAKHCAADADLWFQRKAVLLEAAEKLKGIK